MREDHLARTSLFGAPQFRRLAVLTTASTIALCAAQPAFAQAVEKADEAPESAESEDAIVVTGFKKSLESAQNIKRDADTFVDVITAEDIGALADRSVAEALQRVPGVNISRFEQRNDPDRFSVEGSGVIIRGLPYVRSELNGRDIFSANGGRELSFNDVSPELLGRVEVFKNNTADMIDGGISGIVNLVTRKPLDKPRICTSRAPLKAIMATSRKNGHLVSPFWLRTHSKRVLALSALQLAYAQSELVTRTDASQITDPCYRAPSLTAACIRVRAVGSGGFSGAPQSTPSNFPPAGAVFVPKGAGVRTTDLSA